MGSIQSIQLQGLFFSSVTSVSPDLQGDLCCSKSPPPPDDESSPPGPETFSLHPMDSMLKQMKLFHYGDFLTAPLVKILHWLK